MRRKMCIAGDVVKRRGEGDENVPLEHKEWEGGENKREKKRRERKVRREEREVRKQRGK